MTTAMKFDEDWTKKFYSDNKLDLNLQIPTDNESTKIEIIDAPPEETSSEGGYFSKLNASQSKSSDSYLQSILSPSTSSKNSQSTTSCNGTESCVCYKCQRQRRRVVSNNTKSVPNPYTPLKKIENTTSTPSRITERSSFIQKQTTKAPTSVPTPPITPSSVSSSSILTQKQPSVSTSLKSNLVTNSSSVTMSPVSLSPVSPAPPKPQSQSKPKRSSTIRKTPTLKSYERHMPNPSYALNDSIYRVDIREGHKHSEPKKDLNEILEQQDNYQVSWKEEGTGDDLLTSLVTFQTIFEEKGNEDEGLSDLLERRARELKSQKIRERQEALQPKVKDDLPPRQADCLTMSYRHGPKHYPLTLFHTMKLRNEKERMQAYNMAFQHCINADSGLKSWVKKQRTPPVREGSKMVQAVRKPTVRRSLLHPLGSRKSKTVNDEFMLWHTSSDNLSLRSASKRSSENISAPIQTNDDIMDVLSVAHTFLPNQHFAANTTPIQNKLPYEHIDTPNKPRQSVSSPGFIPEFKDTSSISSTESANGNNSSKIKGRSGRIFSSLARKASKRSISSNRESSIRSFDK